jgi:predicted DNA-binding transcriptional regulator AlpA
MMGSLLALWRLSVTINKTKPAAAEVVPSFPPSSDERPVDNPRARAIVSDPPMSPATFNRGVRDGWLPQPIYVGPKMPRWWPSELREAINKRRMMPREAKEVRRQARLATVPNTARQPE